MALGSRQRLAAVEELRLKAAAARQRPADGTAAGSSASSTADLQSSDTVPNGVNGSGAATLDGSSIEEKPPKRRKRALDVFDDSGSSSSEEDSDAALDWRAKAL